MTQTTSQSDSRRIWRTCLICVALVLIILFAFAPLFHARFAYWDDGANLYANPRMLPPSLDGIAYYWTHESLDLYIPVTYTLWSILATMVGAKENQPLDPSLFHVANVVAHALTSLVVFAILRLLVRKDFAAAGGALLFAIHPMQIEAVGWVSGFKDILAGLFGFIAVWLYLDHSVKRRRWPSAQYLFATVSLLLALLSKPSAMVIPFIAAAIDIFVLHRPIRRALRELSLWFIFAAVIAVVTAIVQPTIIQRVMNPLPTRPLIAADSLAFYLCKLVWPLKLAVSYGRTPDQVLHHPPYFAWWSWTLPVCLFVFLWLTRKRWPLFWAAAAIFILGVAPVLGLVRFDFQEASTVADHYLYLSMLGPALAVAAILMAVRPALSIPFAAAIFIALVFLSNRQAGTWFDDRTIFEQEARVSPDNWIGPSHLFYESYNRQDFHAAETEARAYIQDRPDDPMSYFDLGQALLAQGRRSDSAAAYKQAIHVDPTHPEPYNDLAALYAEDGRFDLAIPLYQQALKLAPNYPDAQAGLARARQESSTRPNH